VDSFAGLGKRNQLPFSSAPTGLARLLPRYIQARFRKQKQKLDFFPCFFKNLWHTYSARQKGANDDGANTVNEIRRKKKT
jgi:hypothetical protein